MGCAPNVTNPSSTPSALERPTGMFWLDADFACTARTLFADPDDCLALVMITKAGLVLAGVSTTAGNASAEASLDAARALSSALVYKGEIGCGDPFVYALSEALRREQLTIFALGPLTNIATLLHCNPLAKDRIVEIVAVGGRRPGQRLVPNEQVGTELRDLNFELDPAAAMYVLRSGIPVRLVPFEAGAAVPIRVWGSDFHGLMEEWLHERLKLWSALTSLAWGSDGIVPFDPVAVASVLWRDVFGCEPVLIKESRNHIEAHRATRSTVTYCTPLDAVEVRSRILHLLRSPSAN